MEQLARCVSYDAHLATAPQHSTICCHNTSFVWECVVEQWLGVHCVWECVVKQWLGVRRMWECAVEQLARCALCVGMCCGAAG